MNKKITTGVITSGLIITMGTAGIATATAQSRSAVKVSKKVVTTKTTTTANVLGQVNGARGVDADLASVLSSLVTKGTINQAQSDAITSALATARASHVGPMDAHRAAQIAVITSTLGITETELTTRLQAGDSLATIAGAKKDALIAALIAAETKEIDAAVTAGKLTADQATTLKSNLAAHVSAEVNAIPGAGPMGGNPGMGPMGGRGHGDHGGRGHGGHGGRGGDGDGFGPFGGPNPSNSAGTLVNPGVNG